MFFTSLVMNFAATVVRADYFSYDFNYSTYGGLVSQHPRCITFDYDNSDIGTIFVAYQTGDDSKLLMYHFEDNIVSPYIDLGILPGVSRGLSVAKGPDSYFHLFFESRRTHASGIKFIQGYHQEGYLDNGFIQKIRK